MIIENTYAGIDPEYADPEKSKVVLIPVPYDGTSTWIKGADKGPSAFLEASKAMELYDIETDSEPYKHGIFLENDLIGWTGPEHMVEMVEKKVNQWLDKEKFVTIIGGEHSITIGCVRAFRKKFENLTVLQIDAHADLRPTYEGTACNHACAVYEASKTTNLIQVGIRSMDVSEKEHLNPDKTFFAHNIVEMPDDVWIKRVIDLCTENVYITIDLDGFDPSVLPSTGTPEPGGLGFYQVLKLVKAVSRTKNLVGFDIMELCPNEVDRASDFLMAKLYYKMLAYKLGQPE
ncbi:MAG: agmatinase [Salibacteraceae bacterium]